MLTAQRFYISGRVQGVGYRNFAQQAAGRLGLTGYTCNLDDGRVEVYAEGTLAQLDELAGQLRRGPRFAEVRHVEASVTPVLHYKGFHIRHSPD